MKMKLFEFLTAMVHKLVFAGNLQNLAIKDCQHWGMLHFVQRLVLLLDNSDAIVMRNSLGVTYNLSFIYTTPPLLLVLLVVNQPICRISLEDHGTHGTSISHR
jgi:hypothetical protein